MAIAGGFDYAAAPPGLYSSGLQFSLNTSWIPAIGARYHVGIDGISLPLYVLTFALSFLCCVYSWRI
ncbi:MAG TPA: NADH-quinone oxidoreductase subunit M, partial [Actinomycetota bacterium]|nr:NADH-quinone oxidoreductase subunit M [Actinomycetota bacterium]